jgi:hypothetical protein
MPIPGVSWRREGEEIILAIIGDWQRNGPPVVVEGDVPDGAPTRYEVGSLGKFDSSLPAYLFALCRLNEGGRPTDDQVPSLEGLPSDLRGLLDLALSVPEEIANQVNPSPSSEIRKLGKVSIAVWGQVRELANFTGRTMISIGHLCSGHAHFRSRDFWLVIQQCGVQALPIVSLISFLIGLILAFVGNVQLSNFGANLFVADLVGIAMVREMGVVMTARRTVEGENSAVKGQAATPGNNRVKANRSPIVAKRVNGFAKKEAPPKPLQRAKAAPKGRGVTPAPKTRGVTPEKEKPQQRKSPKASPDERPKPVKQRATQEREQATKPRAKKSPAAQAPRKPQQEPKVRNPREELAPKTKASAKQGGKEPAGRKAAEEKASGKEDPSSGRVRSKGPR